MSVKLDTKPEPGELRREIWSFVLLGFVCLGIFLTVLFFNLFVHRITRSLLPARKLWATSWLSHVLLTGLLLCFILLFAFCVWPTAATCQIIQFCFGVAYGLLYACLFVKALAVNMSRDGGDRDGETMLTARIQLVCVIFVWGVQIGMSTQWLILDTSTVVSTANTSMTVFPCSFGFTQMVQQLVYVMALLLLACLFAVVGLCRKRRVSESVREGLLVMVSSVLNIVVWIAWVILGFLYSGPGFQWGSMAVGFIINCYIILFTMFIPRLVWLRKAYRAGSRRDDTGDGLVYSHKEPNLSTFLNDVSSKRYFEMPTSGGADLLSNSSATEQLNNFRHYSAHDLRPRNSMYLPQISVPEDVRLAESSTERDKQGEPYTMNGGLSMSHGQLHHGSIQEQQAGFGGAVSATDLRFIRPDGPPFGIRRNSFSSEPPAIFSLPRLHPAHQTNMRQYRADYPRQQIYY